MQEAFKLPAGLQFGGLITTMRHIAVTTLISMFAAFSRYSAPGLHSKWWLIGLLAFTLLGVQVLQESPLHDHAQETVDCALCHLQHLTDDALVTHAMPPVDVVAQVARAAALPVIVPSLNPSPYQGRAPPAAFS